MMATGEVMAYRYFVRAGYDESCTFHRTRNGQHETSKSIANIPTEEIEKLLYNVDDERSFVVFEALKRGISVDKIHEITRIDNWFISKLKNLVELENTLPTAHSPMINMTLQSVTATSTALLSA